MKCDYLVVGCGLYGSVLAERIANDLKKTVIVIDKRPHIGGNCYSERDKLTGIEYHKYGTHIFHTSSNQAVNYINRFTELNGYHHQVLATHKGKVYQMPINLETINDFFNKSLSPEEARGFLLEEIRADVKMPSDNLEDKAVSSIGRKLYEAFIKGYTMKQWDKDPAHLPSSIIQRLPVRFSYAEDYFHNARWQGLPIDGYTSMIAGMLGSKRIKVLLNTDYFDVANSVNVKKKIIYTGPIDKYFGYCYGRLEWRSIFLEKKVIGVEDFQGTSVMNYVDMDVPYTRIHEPRHLHPEREYRKDRTVVFYETPVKDSEEPFYPINSRENEKILKKYRAKSNKIKNLLTGGRLGDYKYYDMDQTIVEALNTYRRKIIKQ